MSPSLRIISLNISSFTEVPYLLESMILISGFTTLIIPFVWSNSTSVTSPIVIVACNRDMLLSFWIKISLPGSTSTSLVSTCWIPYVFFQPYTSVMDWAKILALTNVMSCAITYFIPSVFSSQSTHIYEIKGKWRGKCFRQKNRTDQLRTSFVKFLKTIGQKFFHTKVRPFHAALAGEALLMNKFITYIIRL